MKRNPFEKYLGKEDHLQIAVARYLNLQYPTVFWNHNVNEGKRTAYERYKVKHFGIRAGMPDIMIYRRKRNKLTLYFGLAIELKIKPNKVSPHQSKCLELLDQNSWQIIVCYSFDEAKKVIDEYLK